MFALFWRRRSRRQVSTPEDELLKAELQERAPSASISADDAPLKNEE